jgi:hypothetical protein
LQTNIGVEMTLNSLGLFLTIKDLMLIVAVVLSIAEAVAVVLCLDMLEGLKITANNVFVYIVIVITLSIYFTSMAYLQNLR